MLWAWRFGENLDVDFEEVDVFKFGVSSTHKLYLSHKIGCGQLLTKKVSVDREEKRCKGQTQHLEVRLEKMNLQKSHGQ